MTINMIIIRFLYIDCILIGPFDFSVSVLIFHITNELHCLSYCWFSDLHRIPIHLNVNEVGDEKEIVDTSISSTQKHTSAVECVILFSTQST